MSGIEAYKIGVSMMMDTNIPGVIGSLFSSFEKLNKIIKDTQVSAANLGTALRGLARAEAGLNRVASAIEKINAATAKAGAGVNGFGSSFAKASTDSGKMADNIERSAKSLNSLVSAPRLLGYDGPQGVGGSPSSGALALAGPRALYAASLGGGLTGGGAGGAGGGGGLVGAGAGGGGGLPPLYYNPPGGAGAGGGFNGGAAFALLSRANTAFYIVDRLVTGIAHLTEKAAAFNDALVKLEQRGLPHEAMLDMRDVAFDVAARVPGAKLETITTDAGSLRAVLGESSGPDVMAAVKSLLPHVEEVFAALSGSGHVSAEAARHLLFRAIELGGGATDPVTQKLSPDKFNASLDASYRLLMAAGNVVSERDLLNLSQQGSMLAKSMGDYPAFLRMMIAPLVDMKGSRAGTALQAAGRQLFGGVMTKARAIELGHIMGFDEDAFEAERGGSPSENKAGRAAFVKLKPELMEKIAADMKGGLLDFIEKDIRPGLISKGFVTQEAQNAELFKTMNTDGMRRIVSLFLTNADQVIKEQKMMDNVPPVSEALKMLEKRSIGFNITAMSTSVDNFLKSVETVNAGAIISTTHAVKSFFDVLTGHEARTLSIGAFNEKADAKFGSFYHYNPFEKGFWWGGVGAGPRPGNVSTEGDQGGGFGLGGPRAASHGNATPVYIVNPGDLGRGITTGLGAAAARPPSGPTGHDPRMDLPLPGGIE